MQQNSQRLGYFSSFAACFIMALTAGCASGGFKLTRQYAGFVNKQTLIIRVVLYILTFVVFAVTMLVDTVVFNSIDFWEGRVSAGDYQFQSGDKTFHAHHEILPGSGLKRSTIKVFDQDQKLVQEVVLRETQSGEVEMTVDGQLRAHVRDISTLAVASIFDARGNLVKKTIVPTDGSIAPKRLVAAVR